MCVAIYRSDDCNLMTVVAPNIFGGETSSPITFCASQVLRVKSLASSIHLYTLQSYATFLPLLVLSSMQPKN